MFALPKRKQLEDDSSRMDSHVPQVPPLYMPELGGSVTFELRPAQEQQVLLPSQTTPCKATPGHAGNRASSASAPIRIPPGGSRQHLVTISRWKRAPQLPSLHAWRFPGGCPRPAPGLRHLPRRRRPSRRPCPRGSSRWWLCVARSAAAWGGSGRPPLCCWRRAGSLEYSAAPTWSRWGAWSSEDILGPWSEGQSWGSAGEERALQPAARWARDILRAGGQATRGVLPPGL